MAVRPLNRVALLLLILAASGRTAHAAAPAPSEIRDAEIAMGFDPRGRCPELAHADSQDRSAALVLFIVGPTGVPARASVRSSSGSPSLDQAALDCVARLRYLPAVHAGDGNPMDSWQEIAWKWGRFHGEAAPAAAAPAAIPAAAAGGTASAEARVCLDARGALAQPPAITHSSGDAGMDAAALDAARAAASASAAHGGCLRITVTPEGASHDGR